MFRIYPNFEFFCSAATVKKEKGKLDIVSQALAQVPSAREARSREIPYQQLEASPFTEKMGLYPYFIDHCREATKDLAKGIFKVQNNLIEEITGTPPMTVEDFIRKYRSVLVD